MRRLFGRKNAVSQFQTQAHWSDVPLLEAQFMQQGKFELVFLKGPLYSLGFSMRSNHSDCQKCGHMWGGKWPVGIQ